MKLRLWAVLTITAMALMLPACTRDYSLGRSATSSDTLRPGESPVGVGRQPGGKPVEAPNRVTDPNAPKASNGGSGSVGDVLRGGTAEPATGDTDRAR